MRKVKFKKKNDDGSITFEALKVTTNEVTLTQEEVQRRFSRLSQQVTDLETDLALKKEQCEQMKEALEYYGTN